MYHILYKTTCLITNKYYIGMHSTDNLSDGYMGSGKYIRASIKKYGRTNHICEHLEFLPTREELAIRETEIVLDHRSNELCMNLADGGFGGNTRTGYTNTAETNAKISASLQGHIHSEETKAKIGSKSKGRSNKGFKHSDEAKNNMSIAHLGKTSPRKGAKLSEETKAKLRQRRQEQLARK